MKINVRQVYTKQITQGRKRIETIDYRLCGFFSQDVVRWVEGEIKDTTEIYFSNSSAIVALSKYEEFDAIMSEAYAEDNSPPFFAN